MVAHGALTGVPRADRPTLTAHAANLSWSRGDYLGRMERTSLYGLFFHLLGNHDSAVAAAFRAAWPTWEQTQDGHFLAPTELHRDPKAQGRVFTTLASPFMGTNARKGFTYNYLSCYLQDARGTVTPRPFLAALASMRLRTAWNHPDHDRPLHHDDLRHGVRCGARAEELDRRCRGPGWPWNRWRDSRFPSRRRTSSPCGSRPGWPTGSVSPRGRPRTAPAGSGPVRATRTAIRTWWRS